MFLVENFICLKYLTELNNFFECKWWTLLSRNNKTPVVIYISDNTFYLSSEGCIKIIRYYFIFIYEDALTGNPSYESTID